MKPNLLLAYLTAACGQWGEAIVYLHRSLDIATQEGDTNTQHRILIALEHCRKAQGYRVAA